MHSRTIFFVISLLVLAPFETFADSETQTNWSGGPGIYGPVTVWSDQFYLYFDVEWGDCPGFIALKMPAWHTVDGDFNNARSVYSEDIDGDGDMDVLGAAFTADDITWWENIDGSGTSWTKHTVDGEFDGAWSVYSTDIDGDGDMDVLGAAADADDITWWENIDGTGTSWIENTIDGEFDGAWSVYSEDVDGDGYMDVLGAAWYDDDITWWENSDTSPGIYWTEHTIDGDFLNAASVYSEDIDGDGDMDVLGAAWVACDITWWENIDGSGTSWTEHTVHWDFIAASSVYSTDIDGDGDMDVLGAAAGADDITWWENIDGSGTSWIEHTVDGDFYGAHSVYSEDIDDDGDMDILGAAAGADDITWWDLTAYFPDGSLESSILNTGTEQVWDYLEWNATTPANTSILFQVRASDNYTNMGAWSDTLTSPCALTGILNDGDRYVQYRSILSTSDPDTTPILSDVTITWDLLGIEDDPQVTEYLLFGAEPNPSSGSVSIGFAVPELSQVELSIFDLIGRLVIAPSQGEYSPGVHQVQLKELSPGIYFCRMSTGDFADIHRFVVID